MNNQQQNEPQCKPFTNNNQKFRNTNAGDFITTDQPYQVFPEGIPVSKTKLVRGIKMENRKKVLFSIGLNTLALNPNLTEDQIFNSLFSINNNPKQVNVPLKYSELKAITASIFKKREDEGELIPEVNHIRKVVFNDARYTLSKTQKKAITAKEVGIMKSVNTRQAIYDAIESWDKPEKITVRKLSCVLGKGFSERTIKNYWDEFKTFVKSLNTAIKANNQVYTETSTEKHQNNPDLPTIQEKPLQKSFDLIEDFHNLVRSYDPSIAGELIRRYYGEMDELGIERIETNIKSLFML